ncbi:MAG: TolB protein [Chloroflexota bacterium]|nr:TolB protein [Chloroflexota bacterium]
MAELRPDYEQAPVPIGTPGGAHRRLRIALALTVAGAFVVTVAIQAGWLLNTGSAGVGPSAGSEAVSGSGGPAGSPGPNSSAPPASSSEVSLAPPRPPTSPGLIAVVDDNGALSTMDDGGGSRVSYPAPGVVFGFPAWSSDGSRIAIVGESSRDSAIYVFTVQRDGPGSLADGAKPVVIYRSADHVPFYLYWAPGDRAVAFLASEATDISLRIAPADGSAPLDGSGPGAIIRQGQPLYYDWIDAERLLLHVGSGTDAFTGEVGLDGKPSSRVLQGTGVFRSPSASRDSRYLAYVRSKAADGSGQLVVAARGGSASHQMPVFGPVAFEFDPFGTTLASIAATTPVDPTLGIPIGPLRLMNPATGKIRTLLDGSVVAFWWSPDGKTIAALRVAQPGDDQVTADLGLVLAGAVVPGPSAGGAVQAPGIAVRLTFVDVATGDAQPDRVVRLADHFVNQLLPYFDQYALSHRLWSPDGASILLPLVDAAGRDQVVVVPADGSGPRPITGGAKAFWSP